MAANADKMDKSVRKIIERGKLYSASDAYKGEYKRMALKREADKIWKRIDVLLLPTVPVHDTVADVLSDPIARNARLGMFTNFVNLLDCSAVAVPAFFRENGLPFGVTLVGPAFADESLAVLADRFHRIGEAGSGLARGAYQFAEPELSAVRADERIPLFVVGAHLKGMPLNAQLRDLEAEFAGEAKTTTDYRFYALGDTDPPRPGMIRAPGFKGPGIAGEVWNLKPDAFGAFVTNIPPPLGIGKIALSDGRMVSGFLCESHAVADAREITEYGGWRSYLENARERV
jgi:allophanate hydrolase